MRDLTAPCTRVLAALALLAAGAAGAGVRIERAADGTLLMSDDGSAARAAAPAPRAVPGLTREQVEATVGRYARSQRLDPRLVHAVIQVESAYNPTAVSRAGAMGLMQLMPSTAAQLAVADAYEVDQNVRGGTAYLRAMLDEFGGNLPLALAAYNAGPNAVRRYGGIPPYDETRGYVARVMRLYRGDPAYTVPPAVISSRGRKANLVRDPEGRWLLTTAPIGHSR